MQTQRKGQGILRSALGGRLRRLVGHAAAMLSLAFVVACGGHPDENSGGDAYRNEAQPMPLEEWAAGELDRSNGDTTDWKQAVVDAGKHTIEFKLEKPGAKVKVDVYDKYGVAIGVGAVGPNDDSVSVPVNAKGGGRIFIKIEHRDGDKTGYAVRVVGDADGSGGPDL